MPASTFCSSAAESLRSRNVKVTIELVDPVLSNLHGYFWDSPQSVKPQLSEDFILYPKHADFEALEKRDVWHATGPAGLYSVQCTSSEGGYLTEYEPHLR